MVGGGTVPRTRDDLEPDGEKEEQVITQASRARPGPLLDPKKKHHCFRVRSKRSRRKAW
jgi:hypothetical protein